MSATTQNIKATANGKNLVTIQIQAKDCHVSKTGKTMIVGKVTRPTEIMNADGSGSGIFFSLTMFRYPRPGEKLPAPAVLDAEAHAGAEAQAAAQIGANIPSEVKATA